MPFLAKLPDKIRGAYHRAWSTRTHTHDNSKMLSRPKSHHLREKTSQNLITASWNEITTPASLLYTSQYIIHPSLPPSSTNCIKSPVCPLESGWIAGWGETGREREQRDVTVGDSAERRASLCVTRSKLGQGHIETCKLKISHIMSYCISWKPASVCMPHKVGCTTKHLKCVSTTHSLNIL